MQKFCTSIGKPCLVNLGSMSLPLWSAPENLHQSGGKRCSNLIISGGSSEWG